jgi:hypothetical protein
MNLNDEQIDLLLQPLPAGRVRQVKGNAHLEAWDVRRWMLRIFGWGGWDFTVVSCDLVSERILDDTQNPLKCRASVVYRVIGRLTIKNTDGTVLAVFEDGATGDSQNQPSLGDAHDMALKTAMSQALKRCAMNLGDQFGLGLYNGGQLTAVVGRSAAHPKGTAHETNENVTGGELPVLEPAAGSSTPPVVNAPAAPIPSLESAQQEATDPAVVVETIRTSVLEAMKLNRTEALHLITRANMDAAKAKVMKAQTHTPEGDMVTLDVFLDLAMKHATKKAA